MINYKNQEFEKCCDKCEHCVKIDLDRFYTLYCMFGDIHEEVAINGVCDVFLLNKNQWKDCPDCNNQGQYLYGDPSNPDVVQCEFCWTNEKSVFYNENCIGKKEG